MYIVHLQKDMYIVSGLFLTPIWPEKLNGLIKSLLNLTGSNPKGIVLGLGIIF